MTVRVPANGEGDKLIRLEATNGVDVRVALLQEPVGAELVRGVPHTGVTVNGIQVDQQARVLGELVA